MITNIFWRRTYLFIEYQGDESLTICLAGKNGKCYALASKELENGTRRAKLNIAIAEKREILPEGNYTLTDEQGNPLPCTDQVLALLEDFSHVFLYSKERFAYLATFHLAGASDQRAALELHISFMRKNRKARIQEGRLRPIKMGLNLYYKILSRLFPKNGKRILFLSENMDHIRDNMKAIDARLKERGLDKEFTISYSFRNIFQGRQSPVSWLKTIHKIAKQDYIFVDDYAPIFGFLDLHPKTKLIQCWHAGFGFKSVGYGRFGIDGSPHPYVSCHRKYDYALIGNDHLREIYSEVFGIEESALLATGMPRLEHFLDQDHMEACRSDLYTRYPNLAGKNVYIFAPTYRGSDQWSARYDFDRLDMDRLYQFCQETGSVIIFKMHHFITEPVPVPEEYRDLMPDLSKENLNDLFYISDGLITDYSSCFYDYLLLNKPVLFFVYDKDYYSATRRVHRPVDKVAPGKIVMDFQELLSGLEQLASGDSESFRPSDMLIDKCLTNDKLASDKAIDFILLGEEDADICAD